MDGLKVGRRFTVDGIETFIEARGSSAKEALAFVMQAAEELGAAPVRIGAALVVTNGTPAQQRTRRTKEQIAADELAARTAAQAPPNLPPGVQHAFPGPHTQHAAPPTQPHPIAPTMIRSEGVAYAPPPGAQLRHDVPPVPQQGATTMSGPPPSFAPPPVFTPEDVARREARAAVDHLMGSILPEWRDSVTATVQGYVGQHGGVPVEMMSQEQARGFAEKVRGYQALVDAAPR